MSEKRNILKTNLVIDAVMFIVLMAMAGLGFMIKFIILPGYKANEVYGSNVELRFLGLDRHQWGNIHLYLSLFFLFLLLLHIILHWRMIICIFRSMFSGAKTRLVLSLIVGAVGCFLVLGPFFVKPEITQFQGRDMRHRSVIVNEESGFSDIGVTVPDKTEQPAKNIPEADRQANLKSGDETLTIEDSDIEEEHHDGYESLNINGIMTLREVAERYNIGIEELAGAVKVPAEYADERLGRLRKRYGFDLNDLRAFVNNKINK